MGCLYHGSDNGNLFENLLIFYQKIPCASCMIRTTFHKNLIVEIYNDDNKLLYEATIEVKEFM